MNWRKRRWNSWWLAAWAAVALLGCSDRQGAQVGGDTHWLEACDSNTPCGEGSCLCGVCTAPCESDAQCGEGAIACYAVESPGLEARCPASALDVAEGAGGICLAQCELDEECGEAMRCHAGACVPQEPAPEGGAPTDDGSARAESQLAQVNATPTPMVDFGDPVTVPTPERTVEGLPSALLGLWRPNCGFNIAGLCPQFEFRLDADTGKVHGTLEWTPGSPENEVAPLEGLTDTPDPDKGYPDGLQDWDLISLSINVKAGLKYTILDGLFDQGTFRFWYSSKELWAGWCALQQSYEHPEGEPRFQCVPQAPTEPIDEGRYQLCTSGLSAGACDTPEGPQPCHCAGPNGFASGRCSAAHCRCDVEGCSADLHSSRRDFELRLEAEDHFELVDWYVDTGKVNLSWDRVDEP